MDPWLIWLIIGVVLIVGEIATNAFVLLYFGVGALAASGAAALGADTLVQTLVFGLVSVVLLALTRPLIIKNLRLPDVKSNVHDLVGRTAIVTIAVDNDENTGQVRLGTEFWTARAATDGETFPVDTKVSIVDVDGVTALVRSLA
jgi:membrane protein implicated in regulation of membrane protease activity